MALKSIVSWVVSIIKTTATVRAVVAKLKIAFSKTNRAVMFDILSLLFYVAVLVNFALDKAAPTRLDILIAIGAVLACLVMIVVLSVDVFKATRVIKENP